MARKLNNPDMPTLAYKYDVRIVGDVPQVVWDTGKAMNALWNDLTERHEAFCGAFKDADKEIRKKTFKQLTHYGKGGVLYERAKESKDTLDFRCYWHVYEEFRKAQKRFASGMGGAPKIKRRLDRVLFPLPIGDGGVAVEWLHADSDGRAYVRHEYGLTRGHFVVNDSTVPFEIVMDRPLPAGALIKRVALAGFHERPFEWKWSLIVSLQVPPHKQALKTERVAGIDLGWRDMGDYIRIGMIADSAGDIRELRLPYDLSRNQDRKFIARLEAQGVADRPMLRDIRLIRDMQRKMDDHLEACKIDLAGVDRSAWPDEAKAIMSGVVKMRAGGLRRIRRALWQAGISYEFLEDWHFWHETHLRRYRAAQIDWIAARNYLYRCIARWIADNCDALGWEGDLSLKGMAEQAGKKKKTRKAAHEETGEWEQRTVDDRILEASQKRRQWASLHVLRGYIFEAVGKRGRDLQNHPSAYSTQICDECGLRIMPGADLILSCEDRHERDQDVNAASRYLTLAQGEMRAVAGVSASVNHSQLWKAVRPISPMAAS